MRGRPRRRLRPPAVCPCAALTPRVRASRVQEDKLPELRKYKNIDTNMLPASPKVKATVLDA